jgi:hypothetical protein
MWRTKCMYIIYTDHFPWILLTFQNCWYINMYIAHFHRYTHDGSFLLCKIILLHILLNQLKGKANKAISDYLHCLITLYVSWVTVYHRKRLTYRSWVGACGLCTRPSWCPTNSPLDFVTYSNSAFNIAYSRDPINYWLSFGISAKIFYC